MRPILSHARALSRYLRHPTERNRIAADVRRMMVERAEVRATQPAR